MGEIVFYESANELATLSNTFTVAGVATDPTTVSLAVTSPTGTATTYTYAAGTVTKTSTGVYTKDVACSEDGVWSYVWTGTGAASDVVVGTWTVQGTEPQRMYCTPTELKSRRGIEDSLDDAEILAACEAVSRWIDGYCERRFWRAPEIRTYEPTSLYCLKTGDLVSVTSVRTDSAGDGTFETTWGASDYQLLPVNPSDGPEQRPYTEIRAIGSQTFPYRCSYSSTLARLDQVEVVGVFGWPTVPHAVKHAAAILAGDFFKLSGMAFGLAGYGEYGAVRARPNPIVTSLLAPYRRRPVMVG